MLGTKAGAVTLGTKAGASTVFARSDAEGLGRVAAAGAVGPPALGSLFVSSAFRDAGIASVPTVVASEAESESDGCRPKPPFLPA
eukprot:3209629-Rhodomonas_salina.1